MKKVKKFFLTISFFDARKEAGPEYEWDGPSSKSGEKYNYQYNITAVTGIRK